MLTVLISTYLTRIVVVCTRMKPCAHELKIHYAHNTYVNKQSVMMPATPMIFTTVCSWICIWSMRSPKLAFAVHSQNMAITVVEKDRNACESFAEGVQLRMHMCYINKGLEVVLYVTSLTNKYPNAKTKKQYLRKQVNKEVNEYRC